MCFLRIVAELPRFRGLVQKSWIALQAFDQVIEVLSKAAAALGLFRVYFFLFFLFFLFSLFFGRSAAVFLISGW